MKTIARLTIATLLGMALITTYSSADTIKGKKIYIKQLKVKCAMSGGKFTAKHTQKEWEDIYDAGLLNGEIKKICGGHTVGEKLLPHIYDFAYEYASDSGNVPNC